MYRSSALELIPLNCHNASDRVGSWHNVTQMASQGFVASGCDSFAAELDRLQNLLKEKDRELEESRSEIKALKASERAKEKAVEEMSILLNKLEEKLKANEELLESKNLEIKKLNEEKKIAMATQYAAESTLRRVYNYQPEEELVPFESIIAPYEAEIRSLRQQVTVLQDDNKAFERLLRTKETALLDAEKAVQAALSKAESVEDLQNRNTQLSKQLDIFQEENKILDKMHRQKVTEVEKLSHTVHQLEEAILARGSVVNAIYDYERQLCQLMEEKKTLQRELSRAKITENRVASSAAFARSTDDKAIPLKMWLDERRCMQGEMQQLREKLALAERTAKAEARLKEKLRLRLKVSEDIIKDLNSSSFFSKSRYESAEHGSQVCMRKILPSLKGRTTARSSPSSNSSFKARKNSETFHERTDSSEAPKSPKMNNYASPQLSKTSSPNIATAKADSMKLSSSSLTSSSITSPHNEDDTVSGVLYDMLQKEVINLRKTCGEKDRTVKDKNDLIERLSRKIDTLKKAMETEAKRMRREVAAREKEMAALKHHHHNTSTYNNGNCAPSDSEQHATSSSQEEPTTSAITTTTTTRRDREKQPQKRHPRRFACS